MRGPRAGGARVASVAPAYGVLDAHSKWAIEASLRLLFVNMNTMSATCLCDALEIALGHGVVRTMFEAVESADAQEMALRTGDLTELNNPYRLLALKYVHDALRGSTSAST